MRRDGGGQKAQIVSPNDVTMTHQFVLTLPLRIDILVRFKISERWFLPIKVMGQFLGQVFRLFSCFSGDLEMSRKEEN